MNTPETIYLANYKKPNFLIPKTYLEFDLYDTTTRVKSKLQFVQNSETLEPLVLNGEKLKLISVSVNGKILNEKEYSLTKETLTIHQTSAEMCVEIETEIDPENNKALDGLYKSGGMFCTQNEPEGFRKITYYMDRSDVMSSYTTKVIADKTYTYLLSNGNKIEEGELPNGRHYAVWNDPHKKPTYLFALVAGDLGKITDTFRTASGRDVLLEIYCDKGNESRCSHAMESLKKSMKWDEERFRLEYDLDIYMIVAVNDFNFGAMENKGLNIFNSKYVLADPKSATDQDFLGIENVIGHEYFHNWTGNRVTCRDWFQLTLKEGLTVFRDEEFSADMNSRAVKRIEDVRYLREFQFVEDAGPTAHPIRPESYIEINNFYTATVYSKGAEIIRMIHTFIGEDAFQKGIDLYFEHFDGQAVTTDHFIWAMQEASGFDFSTFKRWYHQAGTPRVHLKTEYSGNTFKLYVQQSCRDTPETKKKLPFTFPLRLALVDKHGNDCVLNNAGETEIILHIDKKEHVFEFVNIPEKPVLSAFRGFSAPVKVSDDLTEEELAFLLAHDNDSFNRYEAGQRLAHKELSRLILQFQNGQLPEVSSQVLQAFRDVLVNDALDGSIRAEILTLPSITQLVEEMDVCDFESAKKARELIRSTFASNYSCELNDIYEACATKNAQSLSPEAVGTRRLKNICLDLLHYQKEDALAFDQFKNATNMTDCISALSSLIHAGSAYSKEALSTFYSVWKNDPLVMNKWFMIQVADVSGALDAVLTLEKDPVFDAKNPNNIRALYGSFLRNLPEFHKEDGSGYAFMATKVIDVDQFNGNMASSLAGGFKKYKKLDDLRQKRMKKELERILGIETLSKDTYETVSKILEN